MPAGITEIDRITRTIGITVQAPRTKWALAIGTLKTHQDRIEGTITISE